MNPQSSNCHSAERFAYAAAIIGAFLIVAVLVLELRHFTQPPPLNVNRAAERAKALAEMRAADTETLTTTDWLDKSKGLLRLRIEDSMKLVEVNWKNPSAARANLIEREEKATYVPPPPKPKPSEFE
jgi:hypothetical protein